MVNHIYYIKFALQFVDMQIAELVAVFNHEVANRVIYQHHFKHIAH